MSKRILALVCWALSLRAVCARERGVQSPKVSCSCFTATIWTSNTACPPYETTTPCIFPLCILLSTTTIPGPNRHCQTTPTTTSLLPCPTDCPNGCGTYISTYTASESCLPPSPTPKPSSTLPLPSRPCYTETISASVNCPEDALVCAAPDCVYLSTRLVPPGPVSGCEVTPTETQRRTCKGYCDADCSTHWTTETLISWK
ncbi:hypothetical protein BS50DRAFT_140949 [Corynespora cassiicola Philippines]|uniref:Uncharacterized protein n=1 Tax=Corynespora cassiicola Philippines TaxID=1448308 RepID=A0A2T2NAG6_CORCC|nr:hypothetical protein BS50DRAFT_140949 [Corynespora cassiicola Philippines]